MSTLFFFGFMASLLISMALLPPLRANASRLHFLDIPDARKVHATPIAKIGGLAFGAGTFAAILMWTPKEDVVLGSLVGGLVILAFGAWDDRVCLGYKAKFAGQFLAACLAIWIGDIQLHSVPFLGDRPLPAIVGLPLTIIFIIGVTNAINLADGLDGLAGGLSFLSFTAIGYLAYAGGDTILTLLVLSLLGGLLGFLRFNTYPARIFMGDAGSQFLGFFLAIFSLILTDPSRGAYSFLLAFLILGLPLLDTIGVFTQRIMEKRSPFIADKNHVHHRLLSVGLSHREAVVIIYMIQFCLVGLSVILRWYSDGALLMTFLLATGSILAIFTLNVHITMAPYLRAAREALARLLSAAERHHWVAGVPIRALAVMTPGFLGISALWPASVPQDMAYVSIALSLALITALWQLQPYIHILVRISLYVGTVAIMYLGALASHPVTHMPMNVYLIIVAFLVALTIRCGEGHRFQATPLDYLMGFLALVIPTLPELHIGVINMGLLTAKIIVLLFAIELLLHAFARRMVHLAYLALWIHFALAVRGLF